MGQRAGWDPVTGNGRNVGTWSWEKGHVRLLEYDHEVRLGLPRSFSIPNTSLSCMSLNHP